MSDALGEGVRLPDPLQSTSGGIGLTTRLEHSTTTTQEELVTMTTHCIHPGEVHSDDLVEVWHGAPEPAYGCGYHALYFADQLMAAHYAQPTCPNECSGTVSGPDAEGVHDCGACGLGWMPEGEDFR